MLKLKYIYIIFFLLVVCKCFSKDDKNIIVLNKEVLTCKEDSNKVKKLVELSERYYWFMEDFKKSLETAQTALLLSKKIRFPKGEILALILLGDQNWYRSNYDVAFKYYFKAYRLSDSIQNKKLLAEVLYNLGWISCIQQHNYKDNIYLYKALKITEELNDTTSILKIYNAMGGYYTDMFINLKRRNDFDSAFYYLAKGIDLSKKLNRIKSVGIFNLNLGELFYSDKKFYNAKSCFENTLKISRENNDSLNIVLLSFKIALCEAQSNKLNEALDNFKFSLAYAMKHDKKEMQLEVLLETSKIYYTLGKYKEGFDTYKIYIQKKSEIDKLAFANSLSSYESNYFLEKSEASVAQLQQANEIQELKNKKNAYFIIGLVIIGIVVVVIALLLYRQNRLKHFTNTQLKEQNQIISQKKQEIDHSIQYAKGIQLAILPDLNELTNRFPESFLYYKPKNIISGDFYWFGQKGSNDYYCLAADCTGHGVPGALMSIIGMDKLIQAIFDKEIAEPNKILSDLNVQIKNVLKQYSDTSIQKDGMDIALLKFNRQNSVVEYSAANRPLYLIRDGVLTEYKANKTAIAGFTPSDQEFTNQSIPIQKNDSLYIFSDGLADQFGGPKGKKMMTKYLKEILISISNLPAQQQKTILEEKFIEWQGTYEQVDDILIIGIKI